MHLCELYNGTCFVVQIGPICTPLNSFIVFTAS